MRYHDAQCLLTTWQISFASDPILVVTHAILTCTVYIIMFLVTEQIYAVRLVKNYRLCLDQKIVTMSKLCCMYIAVSWV